jgi:serine/threonine protein kinase/tetratricopeptide (TPR) repeat protein
MNRDNFRKVSDAPTLPASSSASSAPGPARDLSASGSILEAGKWIGGRFQIMELLGMGGMGAVYKAYDRDIERVIALKCIRPELSSHPEIVQRFTQELLLARQIAHKNVIRIFDVRESGGLKFITMELLEGQSLASLMEARGMLPATEALDIMRQVCSGLAAAHAEGVIHRDLKPSNIMIEPSGRVVVMDFGLARGHDQDVLTKTGAIMGTFQYMSPEQAKGEKADGRSDIFTVGIMLYELLTGSTPYKSDSSIASLLKRTQEAAVPPSTLEASIPRTLNAIVCKCLERDVKARYQTVNELLADLDAVQRGRTASRLPSVVARSGYNRWLVPAVLVLVAALGAAFVMRWYGARPSAVATTHPAIKILLADFQNNTSDTVFDGTLESSFALAMEGAPFISAYNRALAHKTITQIKPDATTLDESNASLVALREGVNVVISGSVKKEGNDEYRISCKAVDPVNTKTIATAESGAIPKTGVLQAVADLAAKMRHELGDTTPESVRREQEETVTSGSIEAVHEYALAQELQFNGKWEDAKAHYSQAIKLDPNMGRAYAGLAVMNANLGRKAEAESYYQAAMAHIDRMTDREKYRTRGGYYLMTRQPEKAIEQYDALVQQYPADSVGLPMLSLAYFYDRDMAKAMDAGWRAVESAPKVLAHRHNYALYAIYAGNYDEGIKAAKQVLEQDPKELDAMKALAMGQTGSGDLAGAASTYQRMAQVSAVGASVANIGLADLAAYQGKNAEAVALLTKGMTADMAAKDQSSAATKAIAMAQSYLDSGEKARAIALADQAVTLSPDPSTMMAAGEVYINAAEPGKATKLVAQLSSHIEPEPQIYALLVQGLLSLKKNQVREAIDAFDKAQKISNTWLGHFYLGRAYLQNKSFPEADSEFELCLKRRGEASAVFLDDVPSFRLLPPLYYYLGRAQEGLKSPAAADSYRTFLKMHSEGHDELTTDARRRIQAN